MERPLDQESMLKVFTLLESRLEAEAGGAVRLVRVIGPRRSYVAGRVDAAMPFRSVQEVLLDDGWALLFYPAPGRTVDAEQIRSMFGKAGESSRCD